jgi:hypothetical protein
MHLQTLNFIVCQNSNYLIHGLGQIPHRDHEIALAGRSNDCAGRKDYTILIELGA